MADINNGNTLNNSATTLRRNNSTNSILTDNDNSSAFPFQIGYTDSTREYILYLITINQKERDDWITAIRAGTLLLRGFNKLLFLLITVMEYITYR